VPICTPPVFQKEKNVLVCKLSNCAMCHTYQALD
jgi:hypothetical protein